MAHTHYTDRESLVGNPNYQGISIANVENSLWLLIGETETAIGELELTNNQIYDQLSKYPDRGLSFDDAELKERLTTEYSEQYEKQLSLKQLLYDLTQALEGLEDGTLSAEEAFDKFHEEEAEPEQEQDKIQLSKRKQAIRARNLEIAKAEGIDPDSFEFIWRFGKNGTREDGSGIELTTDPRRIASGRHATKLVVSRGVSAWDAEGAFMHATADTHGGKSRYKGKNGRFYVGRSGKSVKKH